MTEEDLVIHRLRNPRTLENIDFRSVEISSIRFSNFSDFVDTYIQEAYFISGDKLTEEDLNWLNDHDDAPDIIHDLVHNQIC